MALPGNSSGQGKSCLYRRRTYVSSGSRRTGVCIAWRPRYRSTQWWRKSAYRRRRPPPSAKTPPTALPVAQTPRGEDGKAGHLAHLEYSLQEQHGAHTPGVTSCVSALGHEKSRACFGSPYGRIAIVAWQKTLAPASLMRAT